MVKTDHILFIAAGAFHVSKPSDLIPELQGRFPIRVELEALGRGTTSSASSPSRKSALVKQYVALLATEGVDDRVHAPTPSREIATMAAEVNEKTENIGARRLHTVMERLLDEISFDAPDLAGKSVTIDAGVRPAHACRHRRATTTCRATSSRSASCPFTVSSPRHRRQPSRLAWRWRFARPRRVRQEGPAAGAVLEGAERAARGRRSAARATRWRFASRCPASTATAGAPRSIDHVEVFALTGPGKGITAPLFRKYATPVNDGVLVREPPPPPPDVKEGEPPPPPPPPRTDPGLDQGQPAIIVDVLTADSLTPVVLPEIERLKKRGRGGDDRRTRRKPPW